MIGLEWEMTYRLRPIGPMPAAADPVAAIGPLKAKRQSMRFQVTPVDGVLNPAFVQSSLCHEQTAV